MRRIYLLSLGILLTLTESIEIECPEGQRRFGRRKNAICADEDECENDESVCGENSRCFNTIGSHYCQCLEGFTPTLNFTIKDPVSCEDINECVDQSNDCGPNTECVNYGGGYSCICKPGYMSSNGEETFFAGQGIQCNDRDECAEPSICEINATCHNTPGHFYCICAAGFSLKSGETNFTNPHESCMSVCDIDKSICGEGGVCRNGKDGHECVCRSGFTNYGHKQEKCTGILLTLTESIEIECPEGQKTIGRGKNAFCADEDECETGPSVCGENSRCFNTNGSHYCQCLEGFTPTLNFTIKDPVTCEDINECVDQSIDCGPNTECVNYDGGYSCICKTGYMSSNGQEIFPGGKGIHCIG